MLYDASRAGNAAATWFDEQWWSRRGEVRACAEGRGGVLYIEADGRRLVLRHYRRGGWIARWWTDRYLWRAASLTRSFIEWHMLYVMHRAGLPVPKPIAACYRRTGRYSYSADLLTEQISEVSSLATRLAAGVDDLFRHPSERRRLHRNFAASFTPGVDNFFREAC